ncbi:hypothetical protein C8Q75DRAFT_804772 [Abortiporus biennis]|nr:hypothetical protein C8Q75DRAFT_804772 [Abortiporus biennis]
MAASRSDRKPYNRPAGRPNRADGDWMHDKAPNAPRSSRAPAVTSSGSNNKVKVSNLHYEVNVNDLKSIFGKIGTLVRDPIIRYDRSGRSSGIAIIFFETHEEAAAAIRQFDGLLCKNQPMSIEFDAGPPTRPAGRRAVSAPSPSLINRIAKPPLLERLGKPEAPAKAVSTKSGPGPVRTKPRGQPRARAPKKPQTAEDLDKELDAFMKDDSAPSAAPAAAAAAPAADSQSAAATTNGDVEMAI